MINGAATLVPPTIKKDGKDSCDYGVKARQAGAAPTLEVVQFNATFSFCALPATDGKCVLREFPSSPSRKVLILTMRSKAVDSTSSVQRPLSSRLMASLRGLT